MALLFDFTPFFMNPLIIIGILLLFAIVIYFSFELKYGKHKSKEERIFVKVAWGFILLLISVIFLFTIAFNYIADSLSGTSLQDKEFTTLYDIHKSCLLGKNDDIAQFFAQPYVANCGVIEPVTIAFIGLGIAGIILIILAFARKERLKEKIKEKEHKHCIECGIKLPIKAKHCTECGKKQA